jgi:hypothetical protein
MMSVVGISAARLVDRAFVSLWFCCSGSFYNHLSDQYHPTEEILSEAERPDDVALYLAFPGNPCNILQKHILEALAFSKGPMLIEAPHFTEQAIHGQLKGLGRSRLAQIRVVTSANADSLSGKLLRTQKGTILSNGLRLVDYSVKNQHCSLVVAASCVFCGSYSFTHRPDFDAAILVRGPTLGDKIIRQIVTDISVSRLMSPNEMNVPAGSVKVSVNDLFL